MHSASSGRYQSKLFNFVHKQTRRLSEQFERTIRHVQVATTWSLESLLYPLHLLLQKAQSAGKQLRPGEQKPDPPPSNENTLPEIDRLLAKLTGDVTNHTHKLTQETNLEEDDPSVRPSPALAFIDSAVAKIESTAIAPMSQATLVVQQTSSRVIQVVQTQLNIFLHNQEQSKVSEKIAANNRVQSSAIPALIWAALNFFFGDGISPKLTQNTSASTEGDRHLISGQRLDKKLSQRSTIAALPGSYTWHENLADPWLTHSDLFGDEEEVSLEDQNFASPTSPALTSAPSADYSPDNRINSLFKFLQQPKSGSGLVQKKKSVRDLTTTQKTSAKIATAQQTASDITHSTSDSTGLSQQQRRHTNVEAKPDYIETKAKTIGYQKHPLELILEWLDRAMLWLEEIFAKVFHRLQRLWQGK